VKRVRVNLVRCSLWALSWGLCSAWSSPSVKLAFRSTKLKNEIAIEAKCHAKVCALTQSQNELCFLPKPHCDQDQGWQGHAGAVSVCKPMPNRATEHTVQGPVRTRPGHAPRPVLRTDNALRLQTSLIILSLPTLTPNTHTLAQCPMQDFL
jgi:hypothetical protein